MNTRKILKTLALILILLAKIGNLTPVIIKTIDDHFVVKFLAGSATTDQAFDIYLGAVVDSITLGLNDLIYVAVQFNLKLGIA